MAQVYARYGGSLFKSRLRRKKFGRTGPGESLTPMCHDPNLRYPVVGLLKE